MRIRCIQVVHCQTMSCRVTVLLQADIYTRQTNSATPSNDREPQRDARPSQTTLSMGVSCGAAAISIYNCGRQSDGQLCVKVRGHASSSSPSCDLSWLPSPGSPAGSRWGWTLLHSIGCSSSATNVLCSVMAILRTTSCRRELWARGILRTTDLRLHFSETPWAVG